jgi:hypothetical protein
MEPVGSGEGFRVQGLGLVGEADGFFVQRFLIFPRFLDWDVPDWIGYWWGFWLMLGKLGVNG